MQTPQPLQPAVLPPREAAAYLGIGRTRLDELVIAGEIPRFKLGRVVRFRVKDLDKFLADHTSLATES